MPWLAHDTVVLLIVDQFLLIMYVQCDAIAMALRCPYAQRAWITLVEKNLNFEHRIVDLGNKPKHFKELYASIHPDPTAPAKVTIIIGIVHFMPCIGFGCNGIMDMSVCAQHVAD